MWKAIDIGFLLTYEKGGIVHGESPCKRGKLLPKGFTGQFGPWLREASGYINGRRRASNGFQVSKSRGKLEQGGEENGMVAQSIG